MVNIIKIDGLNYKMTRTLRLHGDNGNPVNYVPCENGTHRVVPSSITQIPELSTIAASKMFDDYISRRVNANVAGALNAPKGTPLNIDQVYFLSGEADEDLMNCVEGVFGSSTPPWTNSPEAVVNVRKYDIVKPRLLLRDGVTQIGMDPSLEKRTLVLSEYRGPKGEFHANIRFKNENN